MMELVAALLRHYEEAALRMADLPVYNPDLAVATVGFQCWAERQIGVLVTPWCMNLICFAAAEDSWCNWGEEQVGQKQMLSLPSGQYECLLNWADNVGGFLSCSLFSPMAEFEDQPAAEATADAVMKALFEAEHIELTDRQRALQAQKVEEQERQAKVAEIEERAVQPSAVSRRRFMTAGLSDQESLDR